MYLFTTSPMWRVGDTAVYVLMAWRRELYDHWKALVSDNTTYADFKETVRKTLYGAPQAIDLYITSIAGGRLGTLTTIPSYSKLL